MATYYFWDEIEDNVVREYDENNNTLASYTTEPALYGSPLSQERNGEKRYFQFDGQGNTAELTDDAGEVVDIRRCTAFGVPSVCTGTTKLRLSFVGARGYIAEGHATYCVRRRVYVAGAARWLSADPYLGPGLLRDLYGYVSNSPVNDNDPSGLVASLSTYMSPGTFSGACGNVVTRLFIAPPMVIPPLPKPPRTWRCEELDRKVIEKNPPPHCDSDPCKKFGKGYTCYRELGEIIDGEEFGGKTHCLKCECRERRFPGFQDVSDNCCTPFATSTCRAMKYHDPVRPRVVCDCVGIV